jgi:tetratricopeptide (TPR) repeat protein
MSKETLLQDHLNKAEGYLMLGLYEDALHEADAALGLDAASYAAHYLKGMALIPLERLPEAEAALSAAIELEPERAEAFVHLAYVHRRTLSLEKAIETILKAIAKKPDMPLANYNLACYYAVKGDAEEALRYLRRAVNIESHMREVARQDEDFDSLRTNADFRRIVETG